MSPRRLLETSRVSGESREIQTCSIFWETFSVSSRSRRRLRDVKAQAMFWSPESPRLISLGSRGDVSLVRAQAIFWSPESPELPQLISRGDVSVSEIGPLPCSPCASMLSDTIRLSPCCTLRCLLGALACLVDLRKGLIPGSRSYHDGRG